MNSYLRYVCSLAFFCFAIFESLCFASGARPIDAIEHVIVITQENWSFDSLFSAVPGVDGLTNGTWIPQKSNRICLS
jgi:phospholipase C